MSRASSRARAARAVAPGSRVWSWLPGRRSTHAKYGEIERIELSRIKQISGPNLARNWVFIPHVTHHDEADITELEAFRKQINSEQDVKVTMVALMLKACVPVLKEHPEFNSSLDGDDWSSSATTTSASPRTRRRACSCR